MTLKSDVNKFLISNKYVELLTAVIGNLRGV